MPARDESTGRFLRTTTTDTSRVCSRCKVEKPLEEFGSSKGNLFDKSYRCKVCQKELRHLPRAQKQAAVRYQERKREKGHQERHTQYMREYRASHPEKAAEASKARTLAARHPEEMKRRNERERKRRKNDPGYHIEKVLRCRMHLLLRRKNPKPRTKSLLGCSTEELRVHIERQWELGMSWENYGVRGWHIDHIKPVADFDLLDAAQQEECFHFTNLRPLWAAENQRRRFLERRIS